jgi:uncharacterized protein YciI
LPEKGVLAMAGQVFDPKGFWGIVIVNAPDAEAAAALLNEDPLVRAKVFRGEVLPYRAFVAVQRAP